MVNGQSLRKGVTIVLVAALTIVAAPSSFAQMDATPAAGPFSTDKPV
jgi:hypothetical protein